MTKAKTPKTPEAVVLAPEPKAKAVVLAPEPKAKAAFRGAGFVTFREKHDPRWCEKAQKNVHDNEDEVAEQLAYEIKEFGWWAAPLVVKYLGHKVAELQVRYATLNAGMIRMNLGNQIRAAIRKEKKS